MYYESLCPYSQEFIHLNLYPAYQKFGKYMSIYFNPFGNAGVRFTNSDVSQKYSFVSLQFQYSSNGNDGWNFDCQHGPNECKGNLYQACLLNALQGQEKLQLDVLNCIMADYQPHLATKKVRFKFKRIIFGNFQTLLVQIVLPKFAYLNQL